MRRRHGFTLVELLVSLALIIFIMAILSESFAAALKSFRELKAVGDMEERLRTVATLLRRDLSADHFEGRRRTSDTHFGDPARSQGAALAGFVRVYKGAVALADNEGVDDYGIPSRRAFSDILHMAIKLRGNSRKDFVTANVAGSPLPGRQTTFFNQPADARYQDAATGHAYSCQWAEVAYFMNPNGQTATSIHPHASSQLFALYRCEYVITADNSSLNSWPYTAAGGSVPPALYGVSCQPSGRGTYFNNPGDLSLNVQPRRRAFQSPSFPENHDQPGARGLFSPSHPQAWAATLLLSDVLSFDVQLFQTGQDPNNSNRLANYTAPVFTDASYDSADPPSWHLLGIKISVRVWDANTSTSRQMTIIQDM